MALYSSTFCCLRTFLIPIGYPRTYFPLFIKFSQLTICFPILSCCRYSSFSSITKIFKFPSFSNLLRLFCPLPTTTSSQILPCLNLFISLSAPRLSHLRTLLNPFLSTLVSYLFTVSFCPSLSNFLFFFLIYILELPVLSREK